MLPVPGALNIYRANTKSEVAEALEGDRILLILQE